jgi:hypothetical protein
MNVHHHPGLASLATPASLLAQQGAAAGMVLTQATGAELTAGQPLASLQATPFGSLTVEEQLMASGLPTSPLPQAMMGSALGGSPGASALPFTMQQQQVLSQVLMPGSATTSLSSMGEADLRQLWQAVACVDPTQVASPVRDCPPP